MKKLIFASALCAMALTACQEEDFGVTSKDLYKTDYKNEFVKQFGNVNPNQDWDGTRATRPYTSVASSDGWYYVEDATLNFFKTEMAEGQNNSDKVEAFTLYTTEETTFEIMPLYQGGAYYDWVVDMSVDGQPVWSWDKGDGQLEGKFPRNLFDWLSIIFGNNVPEWINLTDNVLWRSDASEATALRSKPTKVTVPAGKTITFKISRKRFLVRDVTHTSADRAKWIGILDVETPAHVLEVNPNYTAKIIACEGYDGEGAEARDFNDVAFLLVGYIPEVITFDEEITTYETKRYMMEDFGTIDMDFNDVVVDVTKATTGTYEYNIDTEERVLKPGTVETVTYTATIAHLGGTYPVQIKVGNTTLPRITNPTNQQQTLAQLAGTITDGDVAGAGSNPGWEPNYTVAVEGFDAEKNNIYLTVWKDFDLEQPVGAETVYTSTFPEKGAVPYIIATFETSDWTSEGADVTTKAWWSQIWGN